MIRRSLYQSFSLFTISVTNFCIIALAIWALMSAHEWSLCTTHPMPIPSSTWRSTRLGYQLKGMETNGLNLHNLALSSPWYSWHYIVLLFRAEMISIYGQLRSALHINRCEFIWGRLWSPQKCGSQTINTKLQLQLPLWLLNSPEPFLPMRLCKKKWYLSQIQEQ